MKTIQTSEKVAVENYPYGYTLKTTLYDTIEFSPKKGYRHVTQTINPKTGRLNAPKKSTYYPLMVRYYGEDGHIKTFVSTVNGHKEINKATKFISENFDVFTKEEVTYLYRLVRGSAAIDFRGVCTWGGSKMEELKPFYSDFIKISGDGIEDGLNHFSELVLDCEGIDNTKPADYSPFRTVTYETK